MNSSVLVTYRNNSLLDNGQSTSINIKTQKDASNDPSSQANLIRVGNLDNDSLVIDTHQDTEIA